MLLLRMMKADRLYLNLEISSVYTTEEGEGRDPQQKKGCELLGHHLHLARNLTGRLAILLMQLDHLAESQ